DNFFAVLRCPGLDAKRFFRKILQRLSRETLNYTTTNYMQRLDCLIFYFPHSVLESVSTRAVAKHFGDRNIGDERRKIAISGLISWVVYELCFHQLKR
ncbi:MAG TPA: hypothetical protein VHV54_26695, partial [Candidatus Binatia bacterium]|nr:hypothetical protein [Candidatus Binatia bacterium]